VDAIHRGGGRKRGKDKLEKTGRESRVIVEGASEGERCKSAGVIGV
jgi:hypothetical protein